MKAFSNNINGDTYVKFLIGNALELINPATPLGYDRGLSGVHQTTIYGFRERVHVFSVAIVRRRSIEHLFSGS